MFESKVFVWKPQNMDYHAVYSGNGISKMLKTLTFRICQIIPKTAISYVLTKINRMLDGNHHLVIRKAKIPTRVLISNSLNGLAIFYFDKTAQRVEEGYFP